MPDPHDVVQQIEDTVATAGRCTVEENARNYDELAQELNDLGELAYLTCEMHLDHRALVRKLRAGDRLSPDEMARVRLLMVGDADYYLKYDEEFARAKAEVAKIVGEIDRLKGGEQGADALMHISTLAKEASNLLALARHYLDARERVRRFEAATATGMDKATAAELAHIIEAMFVQAR